MNKFVGEIRGDGKTSEFRFAHNLNTMLFVFDIVAQDGRHSILASVRSIGDNEVVVSWREALDEGEHLFLVLIG